MLVARIPGAYLTACGMLLVLFGLAGGAIALASMIEVPFVGAVVAGMLGYLPLVAAARMLGILVYEKREDALSLARIAQGSASWIMHGRSVGGARLGVRVGARWD